MDETSVVVALRRDVVPTDAGPRLELHPAAGPALRAAPTPGVRAALIALAAQPMTDVEVAALVVATDGEAGLFGLYPLLDALARAGLLEHGVRLDGSTLATLHPLGAYAIPRLAVPDGPLALSRFALVRAVDGALHAAAPRARLDVRLDARAAALLPGLATGATAAELAVGAGLPVAAGRAVLALLVAAGVAVDATRHRRETEDAALATWPAADLWLHSASRSNRSAAGYGPTAPFADRFAALPAVPAPGPGRLDPLPLPGRARADRDPRLSELLARRRTWRAHDADTPITRDQLAELLHRTARGWNVRTAGAGRTAREDGRPPRSLFRHGGDHEVMARPYPSGGGLHELEVYPLVTRCAGLEPGLWHYRGTEHALQRVAEPSPAMRALVAAARAGGQFPADPQVLLVITARFGRVHREYQAMAYSMVLRNVGVLYQTLYLTSTAMGLAGCGLGGGDADDFAAASGLDPLVEGSVGEFALGSVPARIGDIPNPRSTSSESGNGVTDDLVDSVRATGRATVSMAVEYAQSACEARSAEYDRAVREDIT